MASQGIKGLAWDDNGFREATNSVRPIRAPEDLAGLKTRVAGPMRIDAANALGANPQRMQRSEISPALQQGAVDGQGNPVDAVIIPQRVREVQDHIATWRHSYDPIFLGVSMDPREPWDAETQTAVGGRRGGDGLPEAPSREDTATGLDHLREQGMEIYEPSPEEIEAFRETIRPAFKWAATIGPEIVESLKAEAASWARAARPPERRRPLEP